MELHQIRYFLALCEELNFTRAAAVCNVSQPALTKAIKALEDEFGGELFRRERGNSHLTELGHLVRPFLEQMRSAAAAAHTEATNFRTGARAPLRLGVMCTISPHVMIGFFRAIRERLPGIELTILDEPAPTLLDTIMSGGCDAAVLALPVLPDRLDPVVLFAERYAVAFGAGHRFERFNAVPFAELRGEPYVERTLCELNDYLAKEQPAYDVPVDVRFRSEREDWVQALLAAGVGCAVMPESLPRLPGVMLRTLVDPEISRTVSLVTVAGRRYTPAVQAVRDMAKSFPWRNAG